MCECHGVCVCACVCYVCMCVLRCFASCIKTFVYVNKGLENTISVCVHFYKNNFIRTLSLRFFSKIRTAKNKLSLKLFLD